MKYQGHWLAWVLGIGILVGSIALVAAPPVPHWGERHEFDATKGFVRLSPRAAVTQTFSLEHSLVDTVVVWLDPGFNHSQGNLHLYLAQGDQSSETVLPVAAVPTSGTAVFSLPRPLRGVAGEAGTLTITLHDTAQPLRLFFQIDGSIYSGGELGQRTGDLGFQVRYQNAALGEAWYHWLVAAVLVIAGIVASVAVHQTLKPTVALVTPPTLEIVITLALGLGVALFFAALLVQPGTWIGPGDFVKDVAYLQASAHSVSHGAWPVWSHVTCGGLPLLGNPESNALSLGTLLALLVAPEQALRVLLALEAGMGAAGVYVLGRLLGLRPGSSIVASLIFSLAAAYPYRIMEGFTMIGATVAFTPWVLVGYFVTTRFARWWGVWLSGMALAAMFLRGEVHLIIIVLLLLIILSLSDAVRQRRLMPVLVLCTIGAITLLWASPKLLAYGEHADLFTSHLPPHVARLGPMGLLDDVFLQDYDRTVKIPIQYGTEEHWGNFGAYTGWLPWVLAAVGGISSQRWRWPLLGSLIIIVGLGEGSLFDMSLRHVEVLGSLLRNPARLLLLATLPLALLAGFGLQWLYQRKLLGQLLALTAALAILLDLGSVSSRLLSTALATTRATPPDVAPHPMLALHQNASGDPWYHSGVLLKAGYLLPHLCADLNIDHPFTNDLPPLSPLAGVPSGLQPNGIVLPTVPARSDVFINENFMSAWVAAPGLVLESPEKSLHLITPLNPPPRVELAVISATKRAQQIIILVVSLTSGVGVILSLRRLHRHQPDQDSLARRAKRD